MDLLVAQRDHGIGLGRTAGGDIATQSRYANQNYFNKRIFLGCCVLVLYQGPTLVGPAPLQPVHDRLNAPCRKNAKGAPGLAFETWDPRNQCSMDTHDVTTG
jgi:hypothetical protein